MQMVNIFERPPIKRSRQRHIVKKGIVLRKFGQPYPTTMRAHRYPGLCRHKHDDKHLTRSGEPRYVKLTEVNRFGLKELLEHNAVGAMFARRNTKAHGADNTCDPRVAGNIIWMEGFLDPARAQHRKGLQPMSSIA